VPRVHSDTTLRVSHTLWLCVSLARSMCRAPALCRAVGSFPPGVALFPLSSSRQSPVRRRVLCASHRVRIGPLLCMLAPPAHLGDPHFAPNPAAPYLVHRPLSAPHIPGPCPCPRVLARTSVCDGECPVGRLRAAPSAHNSISSLRWITDFFSVSPAHLVRVIPTFLLAP